MHTKMATVLQRNSSWMEKHEPAVQCSSTSHLVRHRGPSSWSTHTSRIQLDISLRCIGLGCSRATYTATFPLPVGRNMPGAAFLHPGTPRQQSSSQISHASTR